MIGELIVRFLALIWYQLLKLVQKYGKIDKFDLLFHKSGALAGQPRGYAFVTYAQAEDAQRAKCMHNLLIGTKKIIVTAAHSMPSNVHDEAAKKSDVNIPALAINTSENSQTDRRFQIQAIEAKLRMMENQSGASHELQINKSVSQERSVISKYQCNQKCDEKPYKTTSNKRNDCNRSKNIPYDRYRRR